jgi:ribonuclease HI
MTTGDKDFVIYTDGACSGNPGPGGWGVYMTYGDKEKTLYGGEPDTTNNRMELQATIEALQAVNPKFKGPITLWTDSTYVLKGITEWITGWKTRGWKNAAKKPVKNEDLWRQLDDLNAKHDVTWEWVKGHAGVEGNERADELARLGVEQVREV